MNKGPQLRELKLTAQETHQLLEWTRRHKTSQALALRARIILACAGGQNNSEVARTLPCHSADGGQVAPPLS